MSEGDLVSKAKVQIMGKQYTLRGDVDPEYMVTLSRYVNEKLQELKDIAPDTDPLRMALLVALNLADELFQAKKKGEIGDSTELTRMQEKTMHLISMLEDGLIGDHLPDLGVD